jgi:acetyltransferase-like isoleucine patch superfamily enzyme
MKSFIQKIEKNDTNLLITLLKYLQYKLQKKNILTHHNTIIKNVKNIATQNGKLVIGLNSVGFVHKKDTTLLNVRGKLNVNGYVIIGKGCRFDIGYNATVNIGNNSYINPFTTIIIMHGLDIGSDCAIAWNCQFLDESFHTINYEGKNDVDNKIIIADHVWIGSNVSICKGTQIAKGSVVASNSFVNSVFTEENVLIAGNPAKIIKHNISWSK